MTVEKTNREDARPNEKAIQVVFPVSQNAKPRALVIHCVDPRFRRAFRKFIEGEVERGCLGYREDEYISLIIPGGISSLSDILALPKQYKVTKEQIEFIAEHFPSIETIILINHEDCAAYKLLCEHVGSAFLRKFEDMVHRQKVDLVTVAKDVLKLGNTKSFKLYMANFADAEHTKVRFEEIVL